MGTSTTEIGLIPAIRKLLAQTGYDLKDIELFEINEAFAAPSVAVERELRMIGLHYFNPAERMPLRPIPFPRVLAASRK